MEVSVAFLYTRLEMDEDEDVVDGDSVVEDEAKWGPGTAVID